MLDTFITDVKRWATQPYNKDGSLLDWVLFVGLILASAFLWSRVIAAILREV